MPALPPPDYHAAQAFFGSQPIDASVLSDWSGSLPNWSGRLHNATDVLGRVHLPFQGSDVKAFVQHLWRALPKYGQWICLAVLVILGIFLVVFYGSLIFLLPCIGFTAIGPAAGELCRAHDHTSVPCPHTYAISAGSIAAALQTFLAPIAAGSLFAMAQAAAMGSLILGPASVCLPIVPVVFAILFWVTYSHCGHGQCLFAGKDSFY